MAAVAVAGEEADLKAPEVVEEDSEVVEVVVVDEEVSVAVQVAEEDLEVVVVAEVAVAAVELGPHIHRQLPQRLSNNIRVLGGELAGACRFIHPGQIVEHRTAVLLDQLLLRIATPVGVQRRVDDIVHIYLTQLAGADGDVVVGVRQGGVTALSFHPEENGDARLHAAWLESL